MDILEVSSIVVAVSVFVVLLLMAIFSTWMRIKQEPIEALLVFIGSVIGFFLPEIPKGVRSIRRHFSKPKTA
jgi:hypothetical protein